MKNRLRNGIALSLIPQIILVQWLAVHPEWVETYYSNGLYPIVSTFFRSVFGWIPFSVGEILYTVLFMLIVRYIIKNWKRIRRNKLVFLRDGLMVLAVFYFTFNLVWGLNYYREPLSTKLGLQETASFEELKELTQKLVAKTNDLQLALTKNDSTAIVHVPYSRKAVLKRSIEAYKDLDANMPFLQYHKPSVKNSMFSTMSSYMGIGGYLNPFTNEAQVNAKTPLFRFPVIGAHEIGHQLGYSAENETNFIGYLVTLKNEDPYFQYSASAYALSYCLNALHRTNPGVSETLYKALNLGVVKNYQELQDFYDSYENPFEPIFKSLFSTFLKVNNQKDGIKSYGKVVNLMVGYHKKHPL